MSGYISVEKLIVIAIREIHCMASTSLILLQKYGARL
jgi:hypothetical protein